MTTQQQMAVNLYGLLEEYDTPRRIINLIPLIDDLNRWNIIIRDYVNYDLDIGMFIVDVNNPIRTYTTGNRPLPIDYGDSMLTFFIFQIKWELDSDMYPMADEIVKMLILNGAKSSPYLYNSWLEMEDYYQDDDGYEDEETYEETSDMYDNIKNYLGLFNTINKLKNVRKRNRKAKTIQKRIRGNRSRLYNDRPTKYMRNIPGLKKSAWNIIDEGLREDEIKSPDREIFKTEHFDPKWMSDREIEGNRLMADYIDDLDKYGGKKKKRTQKKMKGGTSSSDSFHTPLLTPESSPINHREFHDADDGMPDCPICLDSLRYFRNGKYVPLRSLYTTKCDHDFHFDCARRHLLRDNRCPICRNEIDDFQEDDLEIRYNALIGDNIIENERQNDDEVFNDLQMRLNALRGLDNNGN